MRTEDYEQLEAIAGTLDGALGYPNSPERAITRVLTSIATLRPLVELVSARTGEQIIDPAMAEWLTPSVIDVIERTAGAVDELYEALESVLDDTTILEPGSLTSQPLVDMPSSRPAGVRGELIR